MRIRSVVCIGDRLFVCLIGWISTNPCSLWKISTDCYRPLPISTFLVTGSAVHHRSLSSLYSDGIIVSHLLGPWSPLKIPVKCPRIGLRENPHLVRFSLLASFPVRLPRPPDYCEHWPPPLLPTLPLSVFPKLLILGSLQAFNLSRTDHKHIASDSAKEQKHRPYWYSIRE